MQGALAPLFVDLTYILLQHILHLESHEVCCLSFYFIFFK